MQLEPCTGDLRPKRRAPRSCCPHVACPEGRRLSVANTGPSTAARAVRPLAASAPSFATPPPPIVPRRCIRAVWRHCFLGKPAKSMYGGESTIHVGVGCPSFGGQRTRRCPSITTSQAGSPTSGVAPTEPFRVHLSLARTLHAPRCGRPNPSFNLTPSGWLRQPPVAG